MITAFPMSTTLRRIDLRSDTVTLPTPSMLRAMSQAKVGDDVWGEDPTVAELEERVAALLNKEAALFVPSGTMANQIALQIHCKPGDAVFLGHGSHIALFEGGAGAAYAGVQFYPMGNAQGMFESLELTSAIHSSDPHLPASRLVSFENTHNRGGGHLWDLHALNACATEAKNHGLHTHMDGARLWNASIHSGLGEDAFVQHMDTVSVCFSKGLGAPVGSALVSDKARITEARRIRKRMGGGMRQAGYLAAAALYAVEHHRERLAQDHQWIASLASQLQGTPGLTPHPASTNILLVECNDPVALTAALKTHGVLVSPFGKNCIRAVAHLGITKEMLEPTVMAFRGVTS